MSRTKKLITAALATCALGGSALAGTPVAPLADAAAVTSVSGSVFETSGNTRVSGAGVFLHRWNGSGWVSLGRKATTAANGTYFIGGLPDGYYYSVQAYKLFGSCFTGAAAYDGYSNYFLADNRARGATIRISFVRWIYC